jgi:hypothetical protein
MANWLERARLEIADNLSRGAYVHSGQVAAKPAKTQVLQGSQIPPEEAPAPASPTGPCPDCGDGQWWQLPGKPWHCRACRPDMPLGATTLTLACHKVEAQSERAHGRLHTRFGAVCKGLSITPAQLQNEPSEDLCSVASGELTAEGLRLVAETLAAEIRRREVLDMLAENLGITHALTSDDETDPEYVIITLAIRGKATCDLRIPKARYDGLKVLDLIEQYANH